MRKWLRTRAALLACVPRIIAARATGNLPALREVEDDVNRLLGRGAAMGDASCRAMSRPLLPGRPDSYMICTNDDRSHKGNHTACDGRGHILASWLRMPVERYWSPELEAGHHHHG